MTSLKNQQGFSLLQMLIAAGILAIFVGVFSDLLVNLQKEVKRNKNKQDRVLNNYQIDQVVTSSFGMRTSADLVPLNDALKACVRGGPTSACASSCCQNNVSSSFTLLDPRDTNPVLAEKARLSGPTGNPAMYDDNSKNGCTQNCAYSVTTSFTPHCPGGVASCDHAEHLKVEMSFDPVPGKEFLMKPIKKSLIYFVNLNYQPFISPVTNQTVTAGANIMLSVNGNSGHPSEVQNFIFEKCASATPAVATVTCYGFLNGIGSLKIDGVTAGTSVITLQINDAGAENNLSPDLTFTVTVTP
jgi:Tfp pilus assembly protein PilV